MIGSGNITIVYTNSNSIFAPTSDDEIIIRNYFYILDVENDLPGRKKVRRMTTIASSY